MSPAQFAPTCLLCLVDTLCCSHTYATYCYKNNWKEDAMKEFPLQWPCIQPEIRCHITHYTLVRAAGSRNQGQNLSCSTSYVRPCHHVDHHLDHHLDRRPRF